MMREAIHGVYRRNYEARTYSLNVFATYDRLIRRSDAGGGEIQELHRNA